MTVSEARARLADVVDEARDSRAPVFLTRRGRRVAALIDCETLDDLLYVAQAVAAPAGYQGRHISRELPDPAAAG